MEANQNSSPVGAVQLKALIYRKIGRQRADKYFDLLKRFLFSGMDKYKFVESCRRVIGRDNISLHNLLIQTILQNSCVGNDPLPRAKNAAVAASPNVKVSNGLPVPSLGSRPRIEGVSREDGKVVEQAAGSLSIQRNPGTAALEESMYKGAHESLSSRSQQQYHSLYCQRTHELPDTRSLMILLEKMLEGQGLKISVDSCNLINHGLDCYLKRIIAPCIGLAASRGMKERPQHITGQSVTALNGMFPASGIFLPKPSNPVHVSLSDFNVVMESNPCILGGDWAVLLEKACAQAFKE